MHRSVYAGERRVLFRSGNSANVTYGKFQIPSTKFQGRTEVQNSNVQNAALASGHEAPLGPHVLDFVFGSFGPSLEFDAWDLEFFFAHKKNAGDLEFEVARGS